MTIAASSHPSEGLGIAIVGMACRFPGAVGVEQFWNNLCAGVESVKFYSDAELKAAGVAPVLLNNPNFVKASCRLENIEFFDASFFGFNPGEAELIDPQQRLFLECAWEALESAGYETNSYKGSIGVYAGAAWNAYLQNFPLDDSHSDPADAFKLKISNDKDHLCTRVSYKLNLKGPSIACQTACSTSLVAVHLACQGLVSGECDIALAGGVSLIIPRTFGYLCQEGMMQSPDGHCRAFDANAHGTIFGDGLGIVVLKRLADALIDGDTVYAVIRGSAINNDGAQKVGYTAPSVDGQSNVIRIAQAIAEVEPETITYVEAHGTGTELGDPIEIAALTKAFRAGTQKKGFCRIGSVKTNIGHAVTAAGVAGLIKTVLALKYKMVPPSLHFEQPNPKIDFVNSPFYVNAKLEEWPAGPTPRRAGVSSFGIGGTNAHVVLEEAPPLAPASPARPWQLLVLSAKTETALEAATINLAAHLKRHFDLNLADVAFTLQLGRRNFNHRRMVVCKDLKDAVEALEVLDSKRVFSSSSEAKDRPMVFMFPGQGSQYVNMTLDLYRNEPAFRERIKTCSELLKPHLGLDLREVLYPSEGQADCATHRLNQTAITQPALFVIEYALGRMLMDWGVRPRAMIGHSIGEYVAASLAGVFSLEDALALVAARGRLMNQLPSGSMLAVPLPEPEIRSLLDDKLALAAINGPSLGVVSGPSESVDRLEKNLTEKGLKVRRLHTSHAFHSPMMEPILNTFTEKVGEVRLNPPQIPYLSNVTGTWITKQLATDPSYWAVHLRQTVRFSEGVQELFKEPGRVFIEVGPGQTLSSLAMQHLDKPDMATGRRTILSSLRHPQDRQSDVAFLLNSLGRLWLAGLELDWSAFYAQQRRRRLPLPTYPFERQRYWEDARKQTRDADCIRGESVYKKPNIADWFYVPSWKRSIPAQSLGRSDSADQKLSWLVFLDECGQGDQIVERLRQQGQDIIGVKVGRDFSRVGDALYSINPQARSDYDSLIKELVKQNRTPKKIVHLWSVTENSRVSSGLDSYDKSQHLGFYSLLFLAQALGEQHVTDPLEIDVVSNQMQEVNGELLLCPEKATVLGPCKVIPEENPNIICRSIDIDLPVNGKEDSQLTDQLLAEFTSQLTESVVAYRGKHRWVQTFEQIKLNGTADQAPRFREGGVYLITGGLQGLGLVFAEYLARTIKAKLILLGRTPLPAREQWREWLTTHDDQDGTSRKIRSVQELEEIGAEVLTISADVANLEQMQAAISQAAARFGTIHGIVHAARVAGGGVIPLKTAEMAAAVLAPKVKGTLVLNSLLRGLNPEFFVLCSSIDSIQAKPGQVDDCGANSFLDAFAHGHNSNDGTLVVSVNWGAWQGVGMAVDTEMLDTLKKQSEESVKNGMSSSERIEVFRRILGCQIPQLVVVATGLQDLTGRRPTLNSLSGEAQPTEVRSTPFHSRPNLSNQYVPPSSELQQTVAHIWQDLLGIHEVGINDNFFELGGHSLLGTQLLSRIQDAFKVKISLRNLFETPTIAELTEWIKCSSGETHDQGARPNQGAGEIEVDL